MLNNLEQKIFEDGRTLFLMVQEIAGRKLIDEITLSYYGYSALCSYIKPFVIASKNYCTDNRWQIDAGEIAGIKIKCDLYETKSKEPRDAE